MINRKKAVLFLILCLLFLFGCQQNSNKNTSSDAIVKYEYLSLENQYPDEVNNWLNEAKNDTDDDHDVYLLSLDDGIEYVYGKGYNQAKVSYTYEDFDGKINSTAKAILLKGESNDEVLIKITYNTDVDGIKTDVTNDKSEFYN